MTLQSITGYESVQKYLAEGDIDGGYGPGFFSGLPQPSGPGPIPFPVQTSAGLAHHEQVTQEFRVLTNGSGPLQAQGGAFFFFEDVTAVDDDYCTPGSTTNNCPNQQLWTLQDTTASRQRNDAEAIFGSLDYAVTSAFKATAGVRVTEDHKEFATLYSDTVPPPTPPLNASATASNVSWDVSGYVFDHAGCERLRAYRDRLPRAEFWRARGGAAHSDREVREEHLLRDRRESRPVRS